MSYIEELSAQVKKNLSTYLRMHGRTITRNGMFSCMLEHNHTNRDATPSASLSVDANGDEVWYCHVCQRGGTIYDLISELEGVPVRGSSFVKITIDLAQRFGIPFDITNISEVDSEFKREINVRSIYRDIDEYIRLHGNGKEMLMNGTFGRTYEDREAQWLVDHVTIGCVDARKLHVHLSGIYGDETIRQLPIYNESTGTLSSYVFSTDRLTIAVKDTSGAVVGFVSRRSVLSTDDSPKYFNTVKKKSTLFGIDIAAPYIRKSGEVYLVEGPFDALTMMVRGYKNTVALLGLVTQEQIDRLIQLHASVITHVPDGDESGRRATYKLATSVSLVEAFVRAIPLPDGEDPDSYLLKGNEMLPDAMDAISFVLKHYNRFHSSEVPMETRYMEMVKFVASAKKINARLPEYAKIIQSYHGYTIDGIIKDIETNEDRPTSVAHAESKLWKEIEKAKGSPLHEKVGVIENVLIKMKDLAASTSRANVAEMTWGSFLSMFDAGSNLPKRFITGYRRFDTMCTIEGSELAFISGWPSHGKSSMTRAMVYNIIKSNPDTHCLYLSSDDNPFSVMITFISLETSLKKNILKDLFIDKPDEARNVLNPYMTRLRTLFTENMTVVGLADCHSIAQLDQRLLQLMGVHKNKKFVVVVDALNNLSDVDSEDKVYGIESSIRKLKRVATNSNAAFLVINHLTKHDGRINIRPTVANLKGSSFIEYEAKTVILVHMDSHLNRDSKLQWYTGTEMFPVVEVNVAKDKDKKANQLDFFKFNPLTCEFIEATDEEYKQYMTLQKMSSKGYDDGEDETAIV